MSVSTGPRSSSAPPTPLSRRVLMDEDPDDDSEQDRDESSDEDDGDGGYRIGNRRTLSSSGSSGFDGSPQKPESKMPNSIDPENYSVYISPLRPVAMTAAENAVSYGAAAAGAPLAQYLAPDASRNMGYLNASDIKKDEWDATGRRRVIEEVSSSSSSITQQLVVEPDPTAAALPVSAPLVPIRPNPIKTAPPISSGGVTIVAPIPQLSAPRAARPTVPLQPSSSSPQYRPTEDIEIQATKVTHQPKPLVTAPRKEKEAWCDEATALAKQKKKKIEEQVRRQEIQCNFPEADSSEFGMPPTNGRTSANEDMDGDDGAAQYGAQQQDEAGYQQLQQHQQQQQQARVNNRAASSGGSSYGGGNRRSNNIHMRGNDDGLAQQPTPLFERLVTEEVQEIKSYVRIIENQSRRLSDLENFHGDLEARLEVESRGRQQLEATLEAREREWAHKYSELEGDRDHWKAVVKAEQTKNSRLIDQVVRKDQDIHRMLQRKVCGLECTNGQIFRFMLCLPHLTSRNFLSDSTITKEMSEEETSVDLFATYQDRVKDMLDLVALCRDLPTFELTIITRVRTRFLPQVGRLKQSETAMSRDYCTIFSACEGQKPAMYFIP
jgi:hypothetical protein